MTLKIKNITLFLTIGAAVCFFAGCNKTEDDKSSSSSMTSSSISGGDSSGELDKKNSSEASSSSKLPSFITKETVKDQMAMPEKGEEIAILKVKNYGTIKCRLFEKAAPKAVKNFKELARSGKYKEVLFHRVIEDFMIQTGGAETNCIYEKDGIKGFEVELNQSLRHFNGALCMARNNSLKQGQANQFYIVSSEKGKTQDLKETTNLTKSINARYNHCDISPIYKEEDKKRYKELGGYPALDMNYTVFGQVFEGMDVVKKIASCEKSEQAAPNGEKCIPKEEIILENVEIVNYE